MVGYAGMKVYDFLYRSNVPTSLQENIVQIPSGADFEQVVSLLNEGGFIENEKLISPDGGANEIHWSIRSL